METPTIFLSLEELQCICNLTRKSIIIQHEEKLTPGTVLGLVNTEEHPQDGSIKTILVIISDIQCVLLRNNKKIQVCSFHICQVTNYSLAN